MVRLTFDHHYAARLRADRGQKHDPRRSMESDRSNLTASSQLQKTLLPKAPIEGLDESVVGRFAGAGEVERYAFGIGPEIQIAGDELGPLVDPDVAGIAAFGADPFKGLYYVLSPIAEARIDDGREAREDVDDGQNPDLSPGRQLVVHKIHGPGFIRCGGRLAVFAKLRPHPTLRDLMA
jgi:hypothetical protein